MGAVSLLPDVLPPRRDNGTRNRVEVQVEAKHGRRRIFRNFKLLHVDRVHRIHVTVWGMLRWWVSSVVTTHARVADKLDSAFWQLRAVFGASSLWQTLFGRWNVEVPSGRFAQSSCGETFDGARNSSAIFTPSLISGEDSSKVGKSFSGAYGSGPGKTGAFAVSFAVSLEFVVITTSLPTL